MLGMCIAFEPHPSNQLTSTQNSMDLQDILVGNVFWSPHFSAVLPNTLVTLVPAIASVQSRCPGEGAFPLGSCGRMPKGCRHAY